MTDKITHIVCESGGHSSARTAIEVVRKYGKENVLLVNHQCILEPSDVDRFERQVAEYLGLPITYVSFDGWEVKDQFDVVIEKGSFINPNGLSREALCTHVMKTEPFMRWLSENFPVTNSLFEERKECIIYYGFDANEEVRILRRSSIMAAHGYRTCFPLAHWESTISSTLEIGIEPPNSYAVFKHANCIGCLKAGWQHWYCVYVLHPEIWEKGKLAEDKIGYSIHKDYYLQEKEEMFAKMVKCGIEPTEHVKSQTWWSMVKKVLKEYDNTVCEISEENEKPCICFDN